MNLTSIELWSNPIVGPAAKYATLSVSNASNSESYILADAAGLDPEDILNQFYGTSDLGSTRFFGILDRYYNFKPTQRVVTLKIKLNPQYDSGETPGGLRENLYRLIATDRTGYVQIRFMDGLNNVAVLVGSISKVDSDLFTIDSTVTITITCINAFLQSPAYIDAKAGLTPSLVQFTDAVSTAPHGIYIELQLTADRPGPITIEGNSDDPGSAPFVMNYDFVTGDRFIMNSDPMNRELYVSKVPYTFSRIDIIDKVAVNSIWPMVFPGLNKFNLGFGSSVTIMEFKYYNTFWGV